MTLGEFLNQFGQHHELIVFYAVATPLTALLAGLFSKSQGHLSPWRYLYAILVYISCLPGIFAVTLNIYLWFFEGRSILESDIFTQIIPVLVMLLTLWIIRRSVMLDQIPGFDRISGLLALILIIFAFLWILEKTRILFISYFPFPLAILFILGLITAGLMISRRLFR